jgi:hypothetical protein
MSLLILSARNHELPCHRFDVLYRSSQRCRQYVWGQIQLTPVGRLQCNKAPRCRQRHREFRSISLVGAHLDSVLFQIPLQLRYAYPAEVKDRCRQEDIGTCLCRLQEMLGSTRSAGSYDGH